MDKINLVKRKIEEVIKGSSVPEDPTHSKNTLEWLLKLMPDADESLKIAALGHDIERAIEKRKVRRQDYKDYDAFKDAHALNSANVLAEIMQACDIDEKMIDEVFFLVRHHETGGTDRVDILKDADSISYFDVNLPLYFVRNNLKETKRRCLWGYKRLSDKGKKIVAELNYQNKEIESLLKVCIDECEQTILR
jgi:CRISPR/Cas system-associated endonuclease Cas3-HD